MTETSPIYRQDAVRTLPLTKEEEGSSSFSSDNSSVSETSTEALRALVVRFRAVVGIDDPSELLRAGTVKWGGRVLAAFEADPSKNRRWVEVVLLDGASMLRTAAAPADAVVSRFAAYDQAAGL